MLTFPANVRLFLATAPTDMRKGFNGLSTLVESDLGMNPLRGDLFIFFESTSDAGPDPVLGS